MSPFKSIAGHRPPAIKSTNRYYNNNKEMKLTLPHI